MVSVFTAPYLVEMLRVAAVLGVLASVLAAGARGASLSFPCTRAAAKAAMLASPALRQVWPTLRVGGGVGTLICHDFTRDGVRDMAATVFSGGTAGDIAWVVFRQRAGRWSLALRQLQVYKVGLFRVGSDLVESTPVYRQNDPNCCPSGGFDHRRFHWNGARFVVAKRWHTSKFPP
jgi:hypothetical protein